MATAALRERTKPQWLVRPRTRKAFLSVHVITSVGWLGADFCLLLLGVRALSSADTRVAQGACLQMAALASQVTGPLALLALLTGIVVSVTTPWGLFRHVWVVVSLVLTLVMAAAVNLALAPILTAAASRVRAAPEAARVADILGSQALQLVIPPSVALVLLTAVTVINVYKPWGRLPAARPR